MAAVHVGRARLSLSERFANLATPRVAYGLLAFVAVGYSAGVSLPLALAHALPMPEPFLRIASSDYFLWGTFFYAPVIVAAWMLASTVMFLLSRADFGSLLRLTAFATGLGTMGTLLSDLVTSPMRALGVINEQAWEQSIASQGGWFVFIWAWMVLYLVLFVVAYPLAVRVASRASWPKAIAIGVAGFAVFQGFEYIFIR
jgi:hypothetical protein